MMRKIQVLLMILLVFTLASCGSGESEFNFDSRQDSSMVSSDKKIVIEYKTNTDGKMIEFNIDRLLTIEEMILFNPMIDFDYEIEGFTGDIFIEPSYRCTNLDNNYLVPINIEVGNTRYKYSNSDCMYKTINNYNEIVDGYSDDYLLLDTIPESINKKVSIVVYMPDEIVKFYEIYDLPTTYERIGVYSIMFNFDNDGFRFDLINYYRDMSIYEQLYLKHQENEAAINEVLGVSEEINLMDINSLAEITPLIDSFYDIYENEILAIEELQGMIGIGFATTEETDEEAEEETTE